MNRTYPVFLNLAQKKCLVLGGGMVAERKVRALLKSQADITVMSPELNTNLKNLVRRRKIRHLPREYRQGDLKGFYLVIAATNSPQTNELIANEAKSRNSLVNVVDCPELCNFLVPSVVERGDLKIAISTNGKCPALAKKLRKDLEKGLGREYSDFLRLLATLRKHLKERYPRDEKRRKRTLENLVCSNLLHQIRKGKKFSVKDLEKWIS